MNYRKFYEEQTKKKLPSNFHVHHIDQDRGNNNMNNLVALPSKLHHQLHYSWNVVQDAWNSGLVFDLVSIFESGQGCNRHILSLINNFCNVFDRSLKWIDYKHHLLYNSQNIHDIDYDYKGDS